MLLTLADILRITRSRLDDTNANPYLWSDQELIDYANITLQDAAVRASLTVEDNITIAFEQNIDNTWKATYALPSTFLEIRSVRLASNPYYSLVQTSFRKLEQQFRGRPQQSGTPYAYALDLTQAGKGDDDGIRVRTITLIGTPVAADSVYIDAVRLPTVLESDGDVPEIDSIWHADLIYGITALAYLKRDTETYNPNKSAQDFAMFAQRFGERIPANAMRERQIDTPLQMILG